MSKLLYKCITKGTNREEGAPRSSLNWVISKRGLFKIYDDKIECGSWSFGIDEIKNAILYKTYSLLFIPAFILKFDARGQTYQFGFNPWAKPNDYFSFPYTEEKVKLGHSLFTMIIRFILGAYLLYYLFSKI